MTSQWNESVLLVTNDPEIKEKISSSFDHQTNIKVVETSEQAIEYLENAQFSVVIIDTKTTTVKTHYFEDKEMISFLEIAQYANYVNNNVPIVILANALLSKDGSFAAKCGATLIMDRKDISQNKLLYVMRVLRKRTYRTVLIRDLIVGQSYPVDLYHYLPANRRYLVFLRAGESLSEEKKTKVKASDIRHLYVKEEELAELIRALRNSHETVFSEELAAIHSKFRKVLIDFFNISTDGALHFGKILFDDCISIIERIEKLIDAYPDPHTCLEELPYPRWSTLAHGINSAVYAIIFARACNFSQAKELAFASLIHNIGFSEIDQKLLKRKESELTPIELEEYQKHVYKSVEMVQRKKMVIDPLIEKIIIQHHENYDGTGFPNHMAGENILLEASLLSLLGCFDHLHTLRHGEKAKSIYEVWELVKQHHAESTVFKKKFNPTILKKLEPFFTNRPS